MPDTPGKRQRREVKARKRQAKDDRREARQERRNDPEAQRAWEEQMSAIVPSDIDDVQQTADRVPGPED